MSTTSRVEDADPLGDLLDDPGPGEGSDVVDDGRHRPERVPLLSVPEALRSLQLGVGPAAVRGVLVLALVAAVVLAGRWAWVTQRADPVAQERVESVQATLPTAEDGGGGDDRPAGGADAAPVGGSEDQRAREEDGAAGATGQAGGSGGGDQRQQHVVVHVTGAVHDPGVVTLPAGTRVVDAVAAAGGLMEDADESSLNLARQLGDGEQLWVGRPGEEPPPGLPSPADTGGGTGTTADGDGGQVVVVDLNRATRAELEALPGVGPVTAGKILAWRDEHGGFSVAEELLEVSGIGERTLEQLRPYVTVGG